MKTLKTHIIFILLLICNHSIGQINGNKNIETKTFNLEEFKHITINLYANTTIQPSTVNKITITGDSNIINLIGKQITNNTLNIDQVKWIKASKKIRILIEAKTLESVTTDTHDKTTIKNLTKNFTLNAKLGKVTVSGIIKNFTLSVGDATVDARMLKVENTELNLNRSAEVLLNTKNSSGFKHEETILKYIEKPQTENLTETKNNENFNYASADFINFKLKNNSLRIYKLEVIGPKKNGKTFSYGFTMWPQEKIKKYWSVGSKIYKINTFGKRKLIRVITKYDSTKTIKLFINE